MLISLKTFGNVAALISIKLGKLSSDLVLEVTLKVEDKFICSNINHLLCTVKSCPKFPELREVDGHVAVGVRGLDVGDGLGLAHVAPHLADETLQLLHRDHAVAVSVKKFECLK